MTDQLFSGEELSGEVAGVLYADSGTGFGVIELDPDEGGFGARCSGPLANVVEGQRLRLVGRWGDHPRYGPTFEALLYEQLAPTTAASLRAFLSSEQFEVSRTTVDRVVTVFGSGAGRIIEQEPERLVSDAGIDPKVADDLHASWIAGQALADLTRVAEPAGLPYRVVQAIYARYGAEAPNLARTDPYRLLEVEACRFAHADALARSLGVDPTDPRRLTAGARAAVAASRRRDGHQYLTRVQCAQAAAALLEVDAAAASAGIDHALDEGHLAEDEVEDASGAAVVAIYTPSGLDAERDLAADLQRLMTASNPRLAPFADEVAPSAELTTGQAEAVRLAFRSPVSVLTGGPGTGKTRTVEEIVRAAEEHGLNVALCAPTGRAAKRLEELVSRPATTVHRLLEARPVPGGGFVFNYGRDERLPHDLVVCDEVSMCDTKLAAALVAAVDDDAHLVLVGDPDQLPSVGPGDVLADLLVSEAVAQVRLTEVHRQAAGSRIVRLANAVNAGDVGELPPVDTDVFMAEEHRRGALVPRVVEAVAVRAPDYFGVDVEEIQVVAPIYRGPCGVDALNDALKRALNPADGEPAVAGWNIGDRVMQTRNDADLDVSNGDVGTVVDLDTGKKKRLRVAFPRGEVTYEASQARDLTAAWAITVHKSQGGEWPVVVLVADRSHRSMLWRNLAYTAITRAQKALIVVGQAEALRQAARHDVPRNRQTGLAWRLRQVSASVG